MNAKLILVILVSLTICNIEMQANSPETNSIDGIYYDFSEKGTTAIASRCEKDGIVNIPETITVKWIIPQEDETVKYEYHTYRVTEIASSFLSGNNPVVTSITMPNTITKIGKKAFQYGRSLQSITLSKQLLNIPELAFSECTNLQSIQIPEGITSIGPGAFSSCTSLKSIQMPNSLKTIEEGAFSWCESLTSIELPQGLITIGNGTFGRCYKLKDIKIPDSVNSIGEYAFGYCSELNQINLPPKITSIQNHTFSDTNITSIIIPASVTSIGDGAFQNTPLKSIVMPEGLISIGASAFSSCHFTEIKIPQSVTTIKNSAFSFCKNLTHFEFPPKILIVEEGVLNECNNMVYCLIPEKVTSIGNRALYRNKLFNPVPFLIINFKCTVPPQIQYPCWNSPNESIFVVPKGCKETYRSILDSEYTIISNGVLKDGMLYELKDNQTATIWYNYDRTLKTIKLPTSIQDLNDSEAFYDIIQIEKKAFYCHPNLESIEFPNKLQSIGEQAFVDCKNLTSIDIPNSVIDIGDWAFTECQKLENIKLSSNMQNISKRLFEYCSAIQAIEIPNGIKTIDELAFHQCSNLRTIHLSSSIRRIATWSFLETPIVSIYCSALTPPSNESSGLDKNIATVYVPKGCKNIYEQSPYWHMFNIIEDENVGLEENKEDIPEISILDGYITFSNMRGTVHIILYTLEGKQLFSYITKDIEKCNLTTIPSGTYIISIRNNHKVINRKIVIK